ncbi:hypothetical protein NDU88_001971 [Pleurodeles waltl]|uniref:Uncharacterized protein n=1 Tax=Pleurodeles waltl TaxID=8319 RepID=A0AAV7TJC3_PLEWA|nr:hypothetical protein NDU88_001971 [Pleurodeles waltl]
MRSGRDAALSSHLKNGELGHRGKEVKAESVRRVVSTEDARNNSGTNRRQTELRSELKAARRSPRWCQWRGRRPANFPVTLQEKRGHSRCVLFAGSGKARGA